MRHIPTPVAAIAGSLLVVLAPSMAAFATPPDPIEERVEVVERLVLVEVPPGAAPAPEELFVLEGGAAREVVALDTIEEGDWHVLVYVDAARTPAPMVWRGALVLARQAETLTRLGEVRVIESESEGVGEEAPTRESGQLVARLAGVAEKAAEGSPTLPPRGPEQDLEADARLLEATASGCPRVPCLLILISDGYGAETAAAGADAEPVGKRISAAGWTVLALPAVEHDPDQPALPDATGQKTGAALLDIAPIFRLWPWNPRKPRGAGYPLSTLDALTEPRWQPLRTWADLTGGWIVRHQDEVPDLLKRLSWRRLLVYRSPVETADEEVGLISLEVQDANGRSLESPRWVERIRQPGS